MSQLNSSLKVIDVPKNTDKIVTLVRLEQCNALPQL
jgi:hypothetical protein